MCDYTADPFWTADGAALDQLDRYPLSAETISALRAWAAMYGGLADHDYEWPSREALADFDAEGRRLWTVVRAELGPEYEIGYHSELTGERYWGDRRMVYDENNGWRWSDEH